MTEIQGLRSAQSEKMALLTEGKQAVKAQLTEEARGSKWQQFKTSLSIKFNTNDELAKLRAEQTALQKEMLASAKAMDKVVNPYLKARADFVDAKKEVETKLERVEKKTIELEGKVKDIQDPEHKRTVDAKQEHIDTAKEVRQAALDRARGVAAPAQGGATRAAPKDFGKKFDAGTLIDAAAKGAPAEIASAQSRRSQMGDMGKNRTGGNRRRGGIGG